MSSRNGGRTWWSCGSSMSLRGSLFSRAQALGTKAGVSGREKRGATTEGRCRCLPGFGALACANVGPMPNREGCAAGGHKRKAAVAPRRAVSLPSWFRQVHYSRSGARCQAVLLWPWCLSGWRQHWNDVHNNGNCAYRFWSDLSGSAGCCQVLLIPVRLSSLRVT